jgi:hypothetical protein
MNRSKLADLSEIVSSIAIVITLIYLVIEINQNTDAIRTQTAQSILEAGQTELAMMIDNPEIAINVAGTNPLTREQSVTLDTFFASHMRNREFAWLQYNNEAISTTNWKAEVKVLHVWLDSSRFRIWWDKLGRHYMNEEFTLFVDQLIEQAPPATNRLWTLPLDWASAQ